MVRKRGFRPISVRRGGTQTPRMRFGDLLNADFQFMAHLANGNGDDSDDEMFGGPPDDPEPAQGAVPMPAPWRINLVGLSQIYNLLFVAMGQEIHCHVPRGVSERIESQPVLVLSPPVSAQARYKMGYIDEEHPHYINHLIVGSLGEAEIVLCACDDGDVLAYSTAMIQSTLAGQKSQSASAREMGRAVLPLFHENVNMSAWGLAIHTQSRLLAVSSNLRQVTVFYFGLRDGSKLDVEFSGEDFSEQEEHAKHRDERFPVADEMDFQLLRHDLDRRNSFRRVLPLGVDGDNIPTLTFASDKYGEAESVLAKDIRGNLWVLDVWGSRIRKMPTGPLGRNIPDNGMGWNILVLPPSSFLPTRSHMESWGCVNPRYYNGTVDVTPGLASLRDFSRRHPAAGAHPLFETQQSDDSGDSSSDDIEFLDRGDDSLSTGATSARPTSPTTSLHSRKSRVSMSRPLSRFVASTESTGEPTPGLVYQVAASQPANMIHEASVHENQEGMGIMAETYDPDIFRQRLARQSGFESPRKQSEDYLHSDAIIFHTCQKNLTLVPHLKRRSWRPSPTNTATAAYNPLVQAIPPTHIFVRTLERLCLVIHIPELHLLVVGSQAGRVALVTLTKPCGITNPRASSSLPDALRPDYTFRIDQVLPYKSEERQGDRPSCSLLGLAASPICESETRRKFYRDTNTRPTRFRLILYYWDHTVLHYELERNPESNLTVF